MTELQKVLLNYERGGYTRTGLLIELMKLGVIWDPESLKRELPEHLLPEFKAFLDSVCNTGKLPIALSTVLDSRVTIDGVRELRAIFQRDSEG